MDKETNIKIEIVHDSSLGSNWKSNLCFKVTTPDGIEYYFKRREKTLTYSRPGGLNDNSTDPNRVLDVGVVQSDLQMEFTSSWLLQKITTVNKRVINFSYVEETSQSPTQESCEIYNYLGPSSTGLNCGPANNEVQAYRVKNQYSSLRLSSINWDGGSISFISSVREDLGLWQSSSPPKKLDELVVYNQNLEKVRSIRFNYSYFNPSYTGQYQYVFKRLKLDNIVMDNDPKNNFIFDYFSGVMLAKNSNNLDYWGYSNGQVYGAAYYGGLIIGNEIYSGARKFGDINYAKIGTLNKITYPTGGSTKFTFESNIFQKSALQVEVPITDAKKEKVIEVYYDYSQGAYEDLPATTSYQFVLTSESKISIEKNIENTACPSYDPTFSYANSGYPIGRLRRISPTTETVFSYAMPKVNGSNSYCEYVEFNAPHNGSYLPTVLSPGTYVFEALQPPRDVYVKWRLNFLNGLPEENNNTPTVNIVEGGGLRISKIITGSRTHTFTYPTGELLIAPVLAYTKVFKCYSTHGTPPQAPYTVMTYRSVLTRLSNASNALSTIRHGNVVGYDWVEEQISGKGKTRYTFYNEPEEPLNETTPYTESYFLSAPTSIDFKNGRLEQIDYFKGNSIVKTTLFDYELRQSQMFKGFMYNSESNNLLSYQFNFAWYLKSLEVNITKQSGSSDIEEQIQYGYNDYFQPSSIRRLINSRWKIQKIKYANDFSDLGSQSMVSRYMLSIPLEKIDLQHNKVIGAEKVVFYDTLGLTLPKTIFRLNVVNPLDESLYSSQYEKIIEFDRYNQNGNILQLRDKSNLLSYLWGYSNTVPIVKAVNAKYADLEAIIDQDGIQDLSEDPSESTVGHYVDMLQNNLVNAQVSGYVYNPQVGLLGQIDARGIKTNYVYDNQRRLIEVKDFNGDIINAYKYNYRGASLPYTRTDGMFTRLTTAWFDTDYSGPGGGSNFPGNFKITLTKTSNGEVFIYHINTNINKSEKFPVGNYKVSIESLDGLSLSDFRYEIWGVESTNGILDDVDLDDNGNTLKIIIN